MKLFNSVRAQIVVSLLLSLVFYAAAQAGVSMHTRRGDLSTAPGPSSGIVATGRHHGFDNGRHNPHHPASPTPTSSPNGTATAAPTLTPSQPGIHPPPP